MEPQPVAKRSVFREFIAALRDHWRSVLPSVRPVQATLGYSASGDGMSVPKASTFFAGMSRSAGMYVLITFLHSTKPWEVGLFRTMVILSHQENALVVWYKPLFPDDGVLTDGAYDLGTVMGHTNWTWCLLQSGSSFVETEWRPASYDDPTRVIAAAVADVTGNVLAVLDHLGVQTANAVAESDAKPEIPYPPEPKRRKPTTGGRRNGTA